MAVTAPAPMGPEIHAPHGPTDDRPIWRRPNHLRALIFLIGGFAFSYVLTGVIRTAMHFDDKWTEWNAIITVFLIAGPLFWLVGLGCFDYWFRWAIGAPINPYGNVSNRGSRCAGRVYQPAFAATPPSARAAGRNVSRRWTNCAPAL